MSASVVHDSALPILELEGAFRAALARGPVVVTSPTGSGKSTEVPRWCPPPVLVVEPRRVACRSLAQRVAALEGSTLGEDVGYWVRDEKRLGGATRITFATPGVVLRIFQGLDRYRTVVLDELHERSLDVDLLLALLTRGYTGARVAMSATLAGDRVAAHLGGEHLHAAGRLHPVDVRYRPGGTLLPDGRGVEERVVAAVREARDLLGDVLVFLPGKGEIAACAGALAGVPGLDVIELHGGLALAQQARAFAPGDGRKVVLSTNVAETAVTVPGIGVVVDSGLVRRTRYHRGRGYLTRVPVAADSAEQRSGRAGRTGPGVAFRLWDPAAQLELRTPPEIHRESLVPLVLAAAACGARVEDLPLLDAPREHAVAAARRELTELGALDGDGRITERGGKLFGLPLDAPLGTLLVAAEEAEGTSSGVLADVLDLVAMLAPGRRLLVGGGRRDGDPPLPLDVACDAVTLIRALRGDGAAEALVDAGTLLEARTLRRRLAEALGAGEPPPPGPVDRERLARTLLAADPTRAHVARRRGRRTRWAGGGSEIDLARESRVHHAENVEAVVVLDSMALGAGAAGGASPGAGTRIVATAAMGVPLAWLAAAEVGRWRLGELNLEKEDGRPVRVVAVRERVHARRVVERETVVPRGEQARQAVAELVLAGRLFPGTATENRERLAAAALAARLVERGEQGSGWIDWADELRRRFPAGVPEPATWVAGRVSELGVEDGADLALLSPEDLLVPDLPDAIVQELDRRFPRRLELPDAGYRLEYDLGRREVTLEQVRGRRRDPPSLTLLPRLEGFRLLFRRRDRLQTLRDHRGRPASAR